MVTKRQHRQKKNKTLKAEERQQR